MQFYVLWSHAGGGGGTADAGSVAANLQRVFAPVFGTPLSQRVMQGAAASLAVLETPGRGWRPPSFDEDDRGWALAADYPVNGPGVLGMPDGGDDFLLSLCRRLQAEPRPLLRELAPPFCLAWSDKATGEMFLQNDGLGQSQLYEFRDGSRWALSNKVFAFRALGLPVDPDPEAWAVHATLGWFPMELTGYRRIRFVRPATQYRIGASGVSSTQFDVLPEWVRPAGLTQSDCLDLARRSLLELLEGCLPLWDPPEVGLTGGWDSRAVVATLRALGADFSTVVRGLPGRPDVVIASELARIAGFDLKVVSSSGLPPDDAVACRRCISRALLWQAGHAAIHRQKTFLVDRPWLRPKRINVTGQHGEIGRRERALFGEDRVKIVQARKWSEPEYEEFILQDLLSEMPPFLRPSLRDVVREAIIAAYHQADRYGLEGLARVDFFSLYEFTRRKGAGVHAWQPRQLVAPFLNPGFIRAVFNYTDRTDINVFHRHIIQANAPDWAQVPYFEDLEAARGEAGGGAATAGASRDWRHPTGRENYSGPLYWETAGRPLIDEALAQEGFWTEVFDPELARTHWRAAPDILAILHLLPSVIQDT